MYHVPGVGYFAGNVSLSSLGFLGYTEMDKFFGNEPDRWIATKLERVLKNLKDAYDKIAGDPTLDHSKLTAVTNKKAELTKWLMDLRETIVNPTNVNYQSAKYISDRDTAKKAADENDVALPYGAPAELYRAANLQVPGAPKRNGKKEEPRKPSPAEIVMFQAFGIQYTGKETVDELYAALAVKGAIKGGQTLAQVYTEKTGLKPPPDAPHGLYYPPNGESLFKRIPLWVWPVGIGTIGLIAAMLLMGRRYSRAVTVTPNPYHRR